MGAQNMHKLHYFVERMKEKVNSHMCYIFYAAE